MRPRRALPPTERTHYGLSRVRVGPTYPLPPANWPTSMVRAVIAGQSAAALRMAAEALA